MELNKIIEALSKIDDSEALWAIYTREIADDLAGRPVTDEEWENILSEFADESDNLWGALYEVFAEAVSNNAEEAE